MSLESSEGVVLKAFNWSESSRTVVFFTRKYGKLPLIDKGGRRINTKRGKLMPFAILDLAFYLSKRESRGYVRDVDLIRLYELSGDGGLGRLAYSSAACELLYQLLPEEEPQDDLYEYFVSYLALVDKINRHGLPALFVAFFLRVLSMLGYFPSLSYCVGCGRPVEEAIGDAGSANLVPERGGIVCPACQKAGDYYIGLTFQHLKVLTTLQSASLGEAATARIGYQSTAMVLDALTKFLKYQIGSARDLKSLEFLEKLKNSQLTG